MNVDKLNKTKKKTIRVHLSLKLINIEIKFLRMVGFVYFFIYFSQCVYVMLCIISFKFVSLRDLGYVSSLYLHLSFGVYFICNECKVLLLAK